MSFTPGIQILKGPHASGGSGDGCLMDWGRIRAWIYGVSSTFSNINYLSGVEQNFGNIPANCNASPMGLDANGNLTIPYLPSFTAGGEALVDGTLLTVINETGWAVNVFGGGDISNVPVGSSQYMIDTGVGGSFGVLTRVNVALNTVNLANINWTQGSGSRVSNAPPGKNYGYMINGTNSNEIVLYQVEVFPSQVQTAIATILGTSIDPLWTTFNIGGICVDQSDGNPIIQLTNSGPAGNPAYVTKLDGTTGAIIWNTALPSQLQVTSDWKNSSIIFQRLYVITPSHFGVPPVELNTINTATGAITSTSSGLAGVNPVYGPQVSNDSLGVVALQCDYNMTAGGPPPLNSTPTSFTVKWALLYVAAPLSANTNYGGSTRSIVSNAQFSMALTQELNTLNPCGDESPDTIEYITAFESAKRWTAGRH